MEARVTLGILQALRAAIPASISDNTAAQSEYNSQQKTLLAKANGQPPPEAESRVRNSTTKTRKAIRRAPRPNAK